MPGWDCHGLPIELNVEKKKGKVGHKIDANSFRAECRKYAGNPWQSQPGTYGASKPDNDLDLIIISFSTLLTA
jgi:isoleucyl-tRNA synthetase